MLLCAPLVSGVKLFWLLWQRVGHSTAVVWCKMGLRVAPNRIKPHEIFKQIISFHFQWLLFPGQDHSGSGSLGVRQEYTLDRTQGFYRASCTHVHYVHKGRFILVPLGTDMFLRGWRKVENPEETHVDAGTACASKHIVVQAQVT